MCNKYDSMLSRCFHLSGACLIIGNCELAKKKCLHTATKMEIKILFPWRLADANKSE